MKPVGEGVHSRPGRSPVDCAIHLLAWLEKAHPAACGPRRRNPVDQHPASASRSPRSLSSILRRRRETCIWEMFSSRAISIWVIPRKKRM